MVVTQAPLTLLLLGTFAGPSILIVCRLPDLRATQYAVSLSATFIHSLSSVTSLVHALRPADSFQFRCHTLLKLYLLPK